MNEDRYQNGSLRGRSGIPRVGSAAGRSEAESSRPATFRIAGGTAARLAEQERRDAELVDALPGSGRFPSTSGFTMRAAGGRVTRLPSSQTAASTSKHVPGTHASVVSLPVHEAVEVENTPILLPVRSTSRSLGSMFQAMFRGWRTRLNPEN